MSTGVSDPGTTGGYRRGRALFAVVVAMVSLELALVWSHRYFPSNDGPAHQYSACVARRLREVPDGGLARFFYVNPRPVYPNMLYDRWLEAAVGRLDPEVAERLGISLYLLALPLAVGALAAALGGDATVAAALAGLLSLNFHLFMGFFPFLWGVVLALAGLAAVVRALEAPRAGRLALVAGLAALTFLAHLVAFAVLMLVVAALIAVRASARPWRVVAVLAPVGVGAALFWPRALGPAAGLEWAPGPAGRIVAMVTLRVATAFGGAERPAAAWVGPVLLGLALHGALRAEPRRRRALLAAVGAVAIAALCVPSAVGSGSLLEKRLLLVTALLLAVCVRPRGDRARAAVVAVAAAALVGHLLFLEARWREFESSLDRFLAVAGQVTTRRALYAHVGVPPDEEYVVRPMATVHNYVHLATGAPNFNHYQAFYPAAAYFAVAYTPAASARVPDGGRWSRIPVGAVARWAEEILLWDPDGADRARMLATGRYRVVAERGEARLLRRLPEDRQERAAGGEPGGPGS